jgi:hypothetical protein
MSCLIVLSKCPDLCLFWGSMQLHSGRLQVNIDFQSLSPKSDRKEGGDSGDLSKILGQIVPRGER